MIASSRNISAHSVILPWAYGLFKSLSCYYFSWYGFIDTGIPFSTSPYSIPILYPLPSASPHIIITTVEFFSNSYSFNIQLFKYIIELQLLVMVENLVSYYHSIFSSFTGNLRYSGVEMHTAKYLCFLICSSPLLSPSHSRLDCIIQLYTLIKGVNNSPSHHSLETESWLTKVPKKQITQYKWPTHSLGC